MIIIMFVMMLGVVNVSANNSRAIILDPETKYEKRYIKNIVVWEHEAYFVPSSTTKCQTTQKVNVISANFGCVVAKSKTQSADGFTAYGRVVVNQFQNIYTDYSTLTY